MQPKADDSIIINTDRVEDDKNNENKSADNVSDSHNVDSVA